MSDILNLTLKRDVYEGIINGTIDKIVIDYSKWWNRRLKDVDTGRFKDFKFVRISSGNDIKYDYTILNLEQIKKQFVITVDNADSENHLVVEEKTEEPKLEPTETIDDIETTEIVEETVVEPLEEPEEIIEVELPEMETQTVAEAVVDAISDVIETPTSGPVVVNEDFYEIAKKEDIEETSKSDYKWQIVKLLNEFYAHDNVFAVNTPVVTVLPNGRILGLSKRIPVNFDCEQKIRFKRIDIIKPDFLSDEDFVENVKHTLDRLSNNSYVFVKKHLTGFEHTSNGEIELVLFVNSIKKYKIRG